LKHVVINHLYAAVVVCLTTLLFACSKPPAESQAVYGAVDDLYDTVVKSAEGYQIIAEIDHSRLAAKGGEVMPPARVVLFSDPGVNSIILQQEPLAGLDLPFRVLAYWQGGSPGIVATAAEFLERRHGLEEPATRRYRDQIASVLARLPQESLVAFDTSSVRKGQGIATLESNHGFDQTIERLKTDIQAEGDTIWFGEIDFQAEARAFDVALPRLTLLLFGAPGPGAKAMAEFPRMGLDAFCQKLLVHQLPDGRVNVYYNEMPAMAEIHYADSALPHKVINRRMGATLSGAVE
jgi:uncharacterized protein (DUF302 family)